MVFIVTFRQKQGRRRREPKQDDQQSREMTSDFEVGMMSRPCRDSRWIEYSCCRWLSRIRSRMKSRDMLPLRFQSIRVGSEKRRKVSAVSESQRATDRYIPVLFIRQLVVSIYSSWYQMGFVFCKYFIYYGFYVHHRNK